MNYRIKFIIVLYAILSAYSNQTLSKDIVLLEQKIFLDVYQLMIPRSFILYHFSGDSNESKDVAYYTNDRKKGDSLTLKITYAYDPTNWKYNFSKSSGYEVSKSTLNEFSLVYGENNIKKEYSVALILHPRFKIQITGLNSFYVANNILMSIKKIQSK